MKFENRSLIFIPVFSSVLLHHSKVVDDHAPFSTGDPQVVLGGPAGIGDHIRHLKLNLGRLLYREQNANYLLLDGLGRLQVWGQYTEVTLDLLVLM